MIIAMAIILALVVGIITSVWLALVLAQRQQVARSAAAETYNQSWEQDSYARSILETAKQGALNWPAILGLLLMAAIGAGMAGYSTYVQWRVGEAEGWPQTVAETRTISYKQVNSDDSVNYEPVLEYRYTVDGQSYSNDRIDFRLTPRSFASLAEAESWFSENYQREMGIMVRYNPDNPSDSVLEAESDQTVLLIFLVVGGGMVLAGVAGAIFVVSRR